MLSKGSKLLLAGYVITGDDKSSILDGYRVDVKESQTWTAVIQPFIDKGYMYLPLFDKDGVSLSSASTISNRKSGKMLKRFLDIVLIL